MQEAKILVFTNKFFLSGEGGFSSTCLTGCMTCLLSLRRARRACSKTVNISPMRHRDAAIHQKVCKHENNSGKFILLEIKKSSQFNQSILEYTDHAGLGIAVNSAVTLRT